MLKLLHLLPEILVDALQVADGVVHVEHLVLVLHEATLASLVVIVRFVVELLLPILGLLHVLHAAEEHLALAVLLSEAIVELRYFVLLILADFILLNHLLLE